MQLIGDGVTFNFDIPVGAGVGHVERGKYSKVIWRCFSCLFHVLPGLSILALEEWNELSTYTTLIKQCTPPMSSYEVKI